VAGRPQLKRRQISDADIPVASFSDLAFLLIIFFLLATTFAKQTGFLSDIPSGEASQAQETKTLTVALTEDRITLNDQTVTPEQLRRKLDDAKLKEKKGDDKVVLLTASGRVRYQDYFSVMAHITAAGGAVVIQREEEAKKGGTK
jgi:biopolymer transport protein ExbD